MIKNPILKGFNPDPSICKKGDDYYVAVSSFEWFPAIPIYHTQNLKDYTLVTHALTSESACDLRRLPSAKGVWAPCLSYDEEEDMFYIAFSVMNNMEARFFDVDNYVIKSKEITGPWSEPVYVHSAGFDPSLLHDGDKKYIVCLEWETRDGYHKPGTICAVEYDGINEKIIGIPKRIFAGGTKRGCIEGPHIYKRNGYYYLICAEGGTGYGHCVTVARSKDIFGPYESDPNNPILTSTPDFDEMDNDDSLKLNRYNPNSYLQKTGHGSFVETKYGEVYMVHHSSRPFLPELRCTLGRETCIQKMEFTKDGWLKLYSNDNFALEEVEESKLSKDDHEIKYKNIDPMISYYTPRIDFKRFTEIVDNKLHVRGNESFTSMNISSILAKKLQSLETIASTTLEFEPKYYQAYAGLMVYYDAMNYIVLRKAYKEDNDSHILDLLRVENGNRSYVEGSEIEVEKGKSIYMEVSISGRETQFSWGYNKESKKEIGGIFDTSQWSDEYCKYGEFTGTFIGIGCVDALFHKEIAVFDFLDIKTDQGE